MAFWATVYRVLIASPSDVQPERDVVERAIIDWNDEHALDRNVVFLPVRWERASPRGGATGQDIVNEDLVDTSDVLVGTFWWKVGTKTRSERSGSIEEVRRFAESGKPYGLFFKNAPMPMDHDPEQYASLLAFKAEVHGFEGDLRGLTQSFATPDELSRFVGRFLTNTLRKLLAEPDEPQTSGPGSVRTRLDQGALAILITAAVAAIAEDSALVSITRSSNRDLQHMSPAQFSALLEELERQNQLVVKSNRGEAGIDVQITKSGLDRALPATIEHFDRVVRRVKDRICFHSPTTVDEVATLLGLAPFVVRHITIDFADQGLVTLQPSMDQTKISKPTSALCGWEEIRRRKACLVIGPHFPNKGDDRRQGFEVDLLNEGDHEAREIRAMWDVGDGFPAEEHHGPLPYVIPPRTSGPESRYHASFAVPYPERNEDGEPIQGQQREVRLKLTYRDGLEERDEAQFTLLLRNNRDPKRWTAEELRHMARLSPICQGSRMESRQ
jgi:hypothetical protein